MGKGNANRVYKWSVPILANLVIRTVMNKYDFNISFTGNRGCLKHDTLIKTPSGNIAISNLKDRDKVYSYDFKNKKIIETYAKKIDSGIKKIYEIEMEDGRIIKATMDHIFYVIRNNKTIELPLKKIKEGDLLVTMK